MLVQYSNEFLSMVVTLEIFNLERLEHEANENSLNEPRPSGNVTLGNFEQFAKVNFKISVILGGITIPCDTLLQF